MKFYQFLKSIQEGVGDDCSVNVSLWSFGKYVSGLQISIDWTNDFHYRFVVPEQLIDNDCLLRGLGEYIIHDAKRKFMIAEVGED